MCWCNFTEGRLTGLTGACYSYVFIHFKKSYKHPDHSLSDLLLRGVPAGVVHALREVLDEPDSLCDANLLLLSQLSGQSCLAGCWVVDGHMDLLLQKRERERIPNRKVRLNNYFVGRIQREKKSLVTIIVSGWWQEI